MTIGEHLEELRKHVLRALLYVFAAGAVCLVFQDRLMQVVVWPHKRVAAEIRAEAKAIAARRSIAAMVREAAENQQAIREAIGVAEGTREALTKLIEEQEKLRAELAEASDERKAALRARADALEREAELLVRPLAPLPVPAVPAMPDEDPLPEIDPQLHFLGYQDAFLAYLKVALLCALFVASPLVAFELWRFAAEGLYPEERRWIHLFAPVTFGSFAGGVAFGYFILIPASLRYLATYGSAALVVPTITLSEYLGLFLALTLGIGLIFELPLVLVFLGLVGVIDTAKLRGFRRYFLLLAVIIASLVTPTGDPWTLAIVTAPLLGLYELGILGVGAVERARARRAAAEAS